MYSLMKFAMHLSREVTHESEQTSYQLVKKAMRIKDHQRENALIFYQILSTFSLRN